MSPLLCGADQFISKHTANHAARYNGPLDVIVDIGAHVGGFALRMAVRGAGYVVAYEPFPPNFNQLCANIRRNRLDNVRASSLAVVHDDRKRTLLYGFGMLYSGQQSLVYRRGVAREAQEVGCIRFDEVLKQFEAIDVLKVDVEGEEHNLFLKMPGIKALLPRVRYIDVEVHELDNLDFFDDRSFDRGELRDGEGFDRGALQDFLRGQGFEDGKGGDFRSFNKRFKGGDGE